MITLVASVAHSTLTALLATAEQRGCRIPKAKPSNGNRDSPNSSEGCATSTTATVHATQVSAVPGDNSSRRRYGDARATNNGARNESTVMSARGRCCRPNIKKVYEPKPMIPRKQRRHVLHFHSERCNCFAKRTGHAPTLL